MYKDVVKNYCDTQEKRKQKVSDKMYGDVAVKYIAPIHLDELQKGDKVNVVMVCYCNVFCEILSTNEIELTLLDEHTVIEKLLTIETQPERIVKLK